MAQNNKINGGILYFWRRKMKKKMQPKIKGDFLLAAAISFYFYTGGLYFQSATFIFGRRQRR